MSGDPVSEWVEVSAEACGLPPGCVRVDRQTAARLRTARRETFSEAARTTEQGDERFTAELPGGVEAGLEPSGLVAVGRTVAPGDVLIGKVSPDGRDSSLRVPKGLHGVVVEAELEASEERDERGRASVVLESDRPLVLGDVLVTEDGARGVVCEIASLSSDVEWSGLPSTARVAKLHMAEDVVFGRGTGRYSLITQQPLVGRQQVGGQRVEPAQARALADAGVVWTLTELMTNKSDALLGRDRAYASIVRGGDPTPFGEPPTDARGTVLFDDAEGEHLDSATPESVGVLQRELAALLFSASLSRERVGLTLMREADVRALSRGLVSQAETLNFRTLQPAKDGLFCARIFGPTKDYTCACGTERGRDDVGSVCEACGVECNLSAVRRLRFGHVELSQPQPHPWFLEEIGLLLDLPPEQVLGVVLGHLGLADGAVFADGDRAIGPGQTGAAAIEAALEQVDLEGVEATSAGPRADLAEAMLARELQPRDFIVRALPVLPPDLRPLIPLSGGRFASADANDLYRRLINRNLRLQRLQELEAPETITRRESAQLFEEVENLLANGRRGRALKDSQGRRLKSLADQVQVRGPSNIVGKRVDYSGEAFLVADSRLDPGTCRLPRAMAVSMFEPWACHRLDAEDDPANLRQAIRSVRARSASALQAIEACVAETPVLLMANATAVGCTAQLWDEAAVAVDPRTAAQLGIGDVVSVHVPLSAAARAEVRGLGVVLGAEEPTPRGWLDTLLRGEDPVTVLRRAALYGDAQRIDDPVLRAALGREPSL